MSTLSLFVVALAGIVGVAVVAGLGYLVHRRPALRGPLTIALAAALLMVTFYVGLAQVGGQGGEDGTPAARCSRTGR
ncbi:hypothetical protein QF037_009932 [Streptomyces canus]|uniref:hypothetical protein n=1 Tax=Streptomyces canus TaxID=58343 RepID=UPI00277E5615|nr:hypothetical protein [Streptomyces canus]MDQ0605499.1 hypothetical protein [Streptomyces canus]